MTREDLNKWIALYAAQDEGKTVQWLHPNGTWVDCDEQAAPFLGGSDDITRFRIKPEPKLRPWKPEEVPLGAQLREKGKPSRWLIVSVVGTGFFFGGGDAHMAFSSALLENEHSLDHGKTWQACGVEE